MIFFMNVIHTQVREKICSTNDLNMCKTQAAGLYIIPEHSEGYALSAVRW